MMYYLKLMRIFRSDAANGVDNVINLSIPAGERMGQRDVREGVVGTVPADLKFIIGQLKVMKTYVLCLCSEANLRTARVPLRFQLSEQIS